MAEEDTGVISCKLWLLQFFILLGLLVLFIWLGMRPKSPSYTVTDFSVQNDSVPFAIEITNPNKDSEIYYDASTFTCYYYQEILGSALIQSFSQDKEETTSKAGIINLENRAWKALQVEIATKRPQLQVTLVTKVRYRTWGIKSPRQKLHRKGDLPITRDGKIPGKTKLNNGSKKWRIKMT